MKTLNVLTGLLFAILFLSGCAHESSRDPSSETTTDNAKKFHEIRSANFRN